MLISLTRGDILRQLICFYDLMRCSCMSTCNNSIYFCKEFATGSCGWRPVDGYIVPWARSSALSDKISSLIEWQSSTMNQQRSGHCSSQAVIVSRNAAVAAVNIQFTCPSSKLSKIGIKSTWEQCFANNTLAKVDIQSH